VGVPPFKATLNLLGRPAVPQNPPEKLGSSGCKAESHLLQFCGWLNQRPQPNAAH
jgi:hypothetical protein